MQVFKRDNSQGSTFGLSDRQREQGPERVKVFVRVRPAFPKEIRQDEAALSFRSPRGDQIPEILSSWGSED